MAEADTWQRLLKHLKNLRDKPEEEHLDSKLVERTQLLLGSLDTRTEYILELAGLSLTLLQSSMEDLEPLLQLLAKAIEVVSFDDLQASIPIEVVVEGLSSPSTSVQSLSLSYLSKAAESPSGAALVANHNVLVEALIATFLTSPSTETGGTQALKTISRLLSVDNPQRSGKSPATFSPDRVNGQGLLWRRVFHDQSIYNLFFQLTSNHAQNNSRPRSEVTTAQARLLDLVFEMARMRWDTVFDRTTPKLHVSQLPPVDAHRNYGILKYAALLMVDRNDILMANIMIDFYTKLLGLKEPGGCSNIASISAISSPALEFLESTGIHKDIFNGFVISANSGTAELEFVESARTTYISTYLNLYPDHFMRDAGQVESIIQRLNKNLDISSSLWAQGSAPVHDLRILANVPALTLVTMARSGRNPLSLVPTYPSNSEALATLAQIFSGTAPSDSELSGRTLEVSSQPNRLLRAASTRYLFYHYTSRNLDFWNDVANGLDVPAIPKVALSATSLVTKIAQTEWSSLNDLGKNQEGAVPLESELRQLYSGDICDSGLGDLLTRGQVVIELLVQPAPHRSRDPDSMRLAWRITRAKRDTLQAIQDQMDRGIGKAEVHHELWDSTARRIKKALERKEGGKDATHTQLVATMGR